MFATLLAAAALILPVFAQDCPTSYNLATPPSLNQCSNQQITWTGSGATPYWLLALNPSDPCGPAITDYGTHMDSSMTIWNASYVRGQQIELTLIDANDCEVWTGTITVGDGPTNCLNSTQLAEYQAGSTPAAANAEGAPSSSSHKPSSTSTAKPSVVGGVSNGENAATMATFGLPALVLSAAAGIFALL